MDRRASRWIVATGLPTLVGLLALGGCGPGPSAELRVEDPGGVGTGARVVVIEAFPAGLLEPVVVEVEEGFPVSLSLTAPEPVVADLVVEARLAEDGAVLGRAFARLVPLRVDDPVSLIVTLGLPCDDDERCDNDRFCDGPERCVSGVCQPGSPPCPSAPLACVQTRCLESARACSSEAMHQRCEPVVEDGELVARYCDLSAGCQVGQPCDDGGDCADGRVCNGVEQCEAGRCVPGSSSTDDDNPCTVDFCSEEEGVQHATVPDGVPCGASGRLCLDGLCLASACGDGHLDPENDEECDEGAFNSDAIADRCRTDCTLPRCGDRVVDTGECADDGSGQGCWCDAGAP